MNCLGDDALDAYNSLQMKEDPSVNDIIEAFDEFIIGKKRMKLMKDSILTSVYKSKMKTLSILMRT